MARGQLILIEGLDRSGKSTQAGILRAKIENSRVVKFPERTTRIGQIINEYLTDKSVTLPDQAIHLLFSANRWEICASIVDDLNNGVTVVLDRYVYSGIAYSLAKSAIVNTSTQMQDVNWLAGPDKGLPKPDLTLFLTLDLKQIHEREAFGEERYENVRFQGLVKAKFLQLLHPARDPTIRIIDVNNKSIEEVSDSIWQVIESGNHNKATDRPIATLDDISLAPPPPVVLSTGAEAGDVLE